LASAPELIALGRDSKSELQEFLSSNGYSPPHYRLKEESGPPHDRLFSFEVVVDNTVVGDGEGKSKKIAQQAAASRALNKLYSVPGQPV
jgi:ribonuclease-3